MKFKRGHKLFLIIIMISILGIFPLTIKADNTLVVKVAYHSVPNYQNGTALTEKSGWGYDYYQEIAKHANIRFEYIPSDNFASSLELVKSGVCDVMGNLSYSDERNQYISFSELPQGSEKYFIYALASNDEITFESSSLNGKVCAVNKDSYQERLFDEYANQYSITVTKKYFTEGNDKINFLINKEADFAVSTELTIEDQTNYNLKALQPIGESYYYFGISRKSPNHDEILKRFNNAQVKILNIYPNFNETLKNSYIVENDIVNTELSEEEKNYILNKKEVKVGCLNNELPISSTESGVSKGTVIDICDKIANTYGFSVIYTGYNNEESMLDALSNKEIDVISPVSFNLYEAECYGIIMSNPYFEESIRLYYEGDYNVNSYNVAAIEKNNLSLYKHYLQINPKATFVEYDSTLDCIKAVLNGSADFALSYDTTHGYYTGLYYEQIMNVKSHILTTKTYFRFAFNRDDNTLLSIFDRGIGLCDTQFITESLINNSQYENKVTLEDFIKNNATLAINILLAIFLIIMAIGYTAHLRNKKLVKLLRKDELTLVPTGNYFYISMRKMLNKYATEDFDFLVTDIVDFKSYNDQFGAEEGDKLLLAICDFCLKKINDKCVFGRIGNDQYGLLAPKSLNVYEYTYEHFNHEFVSNFAIKNNIKPFEVKFGVYEYVDRNLSCQQMRDRAFIALEEIKSSHDKYIHRYDEKLRQEKLWTQWIAQNMHEALKNNEFEVWYQPKHSLKDNKVMGCEALVRWRNKEKGLISPGLFIPLFEKNGFICELDKYVANKVCQDLEKWHKYNIFNYPISINLSRVDLEKNNVCEYLLPIIDKHNLKPSDIHIEITETAYNDAQYNITEKLESLHNNGFIIEMDDFGTGYSNLNMFGEMYVDIIKLDMKFIQQNESKQNDRLMKYIIDMIKALDLTVIAEGVETVYQIDKLRNMGCDMVQGFYFSKPLPSKEFEEYMNKKL